MKNKAVFIDLDGTLIQDQSHALLAKYLYKKGVLSTLDILKICAYFAAFKAGFTGNIDERRKKYYKIFKGWDQSRADAVFDGFAEDVLRSNTNEELLDYLKGFNREKYYLILISASLEEIAGRAAGIWSLDRSLSTALEKIDGVYTGEISGKPLWGKERVRRVDQLKNELNLEWEDCCFITDSYSDLELLNLCGDKIVVNPDSRLKKYAVENNLKVL